MIRYFTLLASLYLVALMSWTVVAALRNGGSGTLCVNCTWAWEPWADLVALGAVAAGLVWLLVKR